MTISDNASVNGKWQPFLQLLHTTGLGPLQLNPKVDAIRHSASIQPFHPGLWGIEHQWKFSCSAYPTDYPLFRPTFSQGPIHQCRCCRYHQMHSPYLMYTKIKNRLWNWNQVMARKNCRRTCIRSIHRLLQEDNYLVRAKAPLNVTTVITLSKVSFTKDYYRKTVGYCYHSVIVMKHAWW